jgi:hypothetical protein
VLLKRRLGRRRSIGPRSIAARAWTVIWPRTIIGAVRIGVIGRRRHVRPRPPAPTGTPSPAWGPPSAPSCAAPASARTPVRAAKTRTAEVPPLNLCYSAACSDHSRAGARGRRIRSPCASIPRKRHKECGNGGKSDLSHSDTPPPPEQGAKMNLLSGLLNPRPGPVQLQIRKQTRCFVYPMLAHFPYAILACAINALPIWRLSCMPLN